MTKFCRLASLICSLLIMAAQPSSAAGIFNWNPTGPTGTWSCPTGAVTYNCKEVMTDATDEVAALWNCLVALKKEYTGTGGTYSPGKGNVYAAKLQKCYKHLDKAQEDMGHLYVTGEAGKKRDFVLDNLAAIKKQLDAIK